MSLSLWILHIHVHIKMFLLFSNCLPNNQITETILTIILNTVRTFTALFVDRSLGPLFVNRDSSSAEPQSSSSSTAPMSPAK